MSDKVTKGQAIKLFFRLCRKYPLTPIENFQDARLYYILGNDDEFRKTMENLDF